MVSQSNFVARARPEVDLANRWGVYSILSGRWIDMHFASEVDANAAISILDHTKVPTHLRRPVTE